MNVDAHKQESTVACCHFHDKHQMSSDRSSKKLSTKPEASTHALDTDTQAHTPTHIHIALECIYHIE